MVLCGSCSGSVCVSFPFLSFRASFSHGVLHFAAAGGAGETDLYPIAILIDELKHDDPQFRLNSVRRLDSIGGLLACRFATRGVFVHARCLLCSSCCPRTGTHPQRACAVSEWCVVWCGGDGVHAQGLFNAHALPIVFTCAESVDDDDEILLVLAEELGTVHTRVVPRLHPTPLSCFPPPFCHSQVGGPRRRAGARAPPAGAAGKPCDGGGDDCARGGTCPCFAVWCLSLVCRR